jgi:hypothetical protein
MNKQKLAEAAHKKKEGGETSDSYDHYMTDAVAIDFNSYLCPSGIEESKLNERKIEKPV